MSNNYKRHKILKYLYQFRYQNNTDRPINEPIVVYINVESIAEKLKENQNVTQTILDSLENEKYIESINYSTVGDVYIITRIGELAYIDKIFLNKVFWRKLEFWGFILPLILSVIALLNSYFHWWETGS